jgi:hypothetical protein
MPFALFSELIEKQSAGNVNAVLTDLDGALQLDPKQKRHRTSSSFSLGMASKQAASTTSLRLMQAGERQEAAIRCSMPEGSCSGCEQRKAWIARHRRRLSRRSLR